MTSEFPGSTEVVKKSEKKIDHLVFNEDEEIDVKTEITDDVMVVRLDSPLEFSLVYDGEPIDEEMFCIELEQIEVQMT